MKPLGNITGTYSGSALTFMEEEGAKWQALAADAKDAAKLQWKWATFGRKSNEEREELERVYAILTQMSEFAIKNCDVSEDRQSLEYEVEHAFRRGDIPPEIYNAS